MSTPALTPRLIRSKDAPHYLGMSNGMFYEKARPYLTLVKIGKQARAFDRKELDAVADMLKETCGKPPLKKIGHPVKRKRLAPPSQTDKTLEKLLG